MSLQQSPLIQIQNLSVAFGQTFCVGCQEGTGYTGIDLAIEPHQTLGLVGESGSGKSLTALSIVRLLPPNARIQGEIWWQGAQTHDCENYCYVVRCHRCNCFRTHHPYFLHSCW